LVNRLQQYYAAIHIHTETNDVNVTSYEDTSDVTHLTVKLRHRRCQDDERHSNGCHGDQPVAC